MEQEKINVTINGVGEISVTIGTTLDSLAKTYPQVCKHTILAATVDNDLTELFGGVSDGCHVRFLDITDSNGYRVYQRSVSFLMLYAAKSVLGHKTRVIIEHSINKAYYCEIPDITITEELLKQIEAKMREVVDADLPFEKKYMLYKDGLRIAEEMGLSDKVQMLKYRRTTFVNFYKLDWFYDYFYGPMVLSAGVLKLFKLSVTDKGFTLSFPSPHDPSQISDDKHLAKISRIFNESNEWAKILRADTVGALNQIICDGGTDEFIRVNEALHEKKIAQIADMILERGSRLVLIAGPSSSGKTTFALRLIIQMRVNGLRPHKISVDNYFNDAATAPRDADGKIDFEAFEHVNSDLLNEHLERLLRGETVQLPRFDFSVGKRFPNGEIMKLDDNDVLVVEGIHCLNERLTRVIPKENKFKIFISALTQLNLDDHNRIPTADTRLIRRIVRDKMTRNYTAQQTISVWPNVTRGEDQHIFPYQEEADAMFNSALVYEMCILKQYVEPLLFSITPDMPEYTEARRLVKFLDSFMNLDSDSVPKTSILREFIGGSCFNT